MKTFHAHIYYSIEQKDTALIFYHSISSTIGKLIQKLSPLNDEPIGPHPKPSFELHFDENEYLDVVKFLKNNHGEHSVLIHIDTGDDVKDHSENISWLGKPVQLDFNFFEYIKTHPEARINQ